MRKKLLILTSLVMTLSFSAATVSAATLPAAVLPAEANYKLYANCVDAVGEAQVISDNKLRVNPENALGEYDATQTAGEDKFYSLASHTYTTYSFCKLFFNVANQGEEADVLLNEVTWGKWHVEACKVYLKNAYIRNECGQIVPYCRKDDGYGYYTGIAWNKVGQQVDAETKAAIEKEGYENRKFVENYYKEEGNFQWTGINFPEEVVYAEGITLVDITNEVHDIGVGTPLYNPNSYKANDGGYDLDAISVYSADPMISIKDAGGDCATGLGNRFLEKNTWYMYNTYNKNDASTHTFDIQAGDPKFGTKIIGKCTVTNNGNGKYSVDYKMDDTILIDGYKYKIVVKDQYLGISNLTTSHMQMFFDEERFGVPFKELDGKFNVFVHFEVEYKAYINYTPNVTE